MTIISLSCQLNQRVCDVISRRVRKEKACPAHVTKWFRPNLGSNQQCSRNLMRWNLTNDGLSITLRSSTSPKIMCMCESTTLSQSVYHSPRLLMFFRDLFFGLSKLSWDRSWSVCQLTCHAFGSQLAHWAAHVNSIRPVIISTASLPASPALTLCYDYGIQGQWSKLYCKLNVKN